MPIPIDPPYRDPEWLPASQVDCYRAGWTAARDAVATGPAEGEALRRLIEKWRRSAAVPHQSNWEDGRNITLKMCADELEAALAPLSGPVDGPTCAKHGAFDARCETCPFCLQERSLKRLAGPVDASGEPAPFDTDKAVAELKAAGWVSDGYGTRWTAPDGVIWRGPAGAWRVMCRQRDEALCRDGSTPEHPRLDGSYGWPKTPRGEAEALTDDFRRKWPNVQGIDRESLVGWFQTAMCIGAQSAAAAVPSSPAQLNERVEELAAQFITAIEHDPAIATDMASVESWLRRAAALPPSSPVADSPKCDPRNGCAQCNPDYPSAPSPSAGADKP